MHCLVTNNKIIFFRCCVSGVDCTLAEFSHEGFFKMFDFCKNKKELLEKIFHLKNEFTSQDVGKHSICNNAERCNWKDTKLKTITISNYCCNLVCKMCRYDYYCNDYVLDTYFKVLEEFKGIGIDNIIFNTSGEPFLRKEKILEYLKSLNKNDFKKAGFITNGTLLDREFIDELSKINNIKIGITVSMDSINPDTYKSIRRNDNFDKVMDNILYLKSKNLLNHVNIVIQKNNLNEINDMPGFWDNLNIKSQYMAQRGRTLKEDAIIFETDIYKNFVEKYHDRIEGYKPELYLES